MSENGWFNEIFNRFLYKLDYRKGIDYELDEFYKKDITPENEVLILNWAMASMEIRKLEKIEQEKLSNFL